VRKRDIACGRDVVGLRRVEYATVGAVNCYIITAMLETSDADSCVELNLLASK